MLRPLERLIYRLGGVSEEAEQRWTQYAASLLAFSVVSFSVRLRDPAPAGLPAVEPDALRHGGRSLGATPVTPDLAFNTAVSFMTNTNWQAYGGETTLSYFVQMAALTVQNFVSAAAGIAVAMALDPRLRPAAERNHRQLLGRPHARDASTCCCRSRLLPRLSSARRAWSRTSSLHARSPTVEGATQTIRAGSGRLAGSDQGAGHQWRRLFQRQLRASVREPHAAYQLPRDAADLPDSRRADLHLRPHGRRHAAGLGALCRHGVDVSARASSSVTTTSRRAIRSWQTRAADAATAHASRAATWKAKKCASASPPRRCSPR